MIPQSGVQHDPHRPSGGWTLPLPHGNKRPIHLKPWNLNASSSSSSRLASSCRNTASAASAPAARSGWWASEHAAEPWMDVFGTGGGRLAVIFLRNGHVGSHCRVPWVVMPVVAEDGKQHGRRMYSRTDRPLFATLLMRKGARWIWRAGGGTNRNLRQDDDTGQIKTTLCHAVYCNPSLANLFQLVDLAPSFPGVQIYDLNCGRTPGVSQRPQSGKARVSAIPLDLEPGSQAKPVVLRQFFRFLRAAGQSLRAASCVGLIRKISRLPNSVKLGSVLDSLNYVLCPESKCHARGSFTEGVIEITHGQTQRFLSPTETRVRFAHPREWCLNPFAIK